MIRPAKPEDLLDLFALAVRAYGHMGIDESKTWEWLFITLSNPPPNMVFLRSDHGAIVATLSHAFWKPDERNLDMMFLATDGCGQGMASEGYRLLKAMVDCARSLGASFNIHVESGFDLTPLVKRLGGVEVTTPSYRVEPDAEGRRR